MTEKTTPDVERKDEHPQTGPTVIITINNKAFSIHRGRQTVAHLKEVGGVSQGFDLDQVIDGKLVPLPDNGAVTIKGGEKFISRPKDSAAS